MLEKDPGDDARKANEKVETIEELIKMVLSIPKSYTPAMDLLTTEAAIKFVKDMFETELAAALSLHRVSAPLFVVPNTGLNDGLNGIERAVSFDIPALKEGEDSPVVAEIVHSLAKWKRWALGRYQIPAGQGLYTDMNAIRRDEVLDHTHSCYVDQWDWEAHITEAERTPEFILSVVRKIYAALRKVEAAVCAKYPQIKPSLSETITPVTTQQLEEEFPTLTPAQRETAALKKYGSIFLQCIGGRLKASGLPHDGRAPDYDDWQLNGDIIVWDSVQAQALELSSMGIRVDAAAMESQLKSAGKWEECKDKEFHRGVLGHTLPLSVGGGIGQSRICMFLLHKAHVGEVQASLWPQEMGRTCEKAGIPLL
eukprot:GCRY01001727.1.p1 GENE.GCRY01001727.1~~GCRY01001727.1.p1  ORF type:complete len:368 (+),score=122.23 GCRY01001727.1:61-1164(+)